jgi:hypothetical protein
MNEEKEINSSSKEVKEAGVSKGDQERDQLG